MYICSTGDKLYPMKIVDDLIGDIGIYIPRYIVLNDTNWKKFMLELDTVRGVILKENKENT